MSEETKIKYGIHKNSPEKKQKENDINCAKELGYPDKVIAMLMLEDDPNKRSDILTNARKGFYGGVR